MNILEKLKAVGLFFPKLKSVSLLKLSINIDKSTHAEGSTIIINPNKLKGKQKRALKQIIRSEALDSSGAILAEKNVMEVEEVVDSLPNIHEKTDKFKPIIPASDIPLLNACVYLRLKFEKGECIEKLKSEIIRVYGTRGGNFANLCSAGYLETWFLPLYDELMRSNPDNPVEAKARFLSLYKTILNELPWTEFVSGRHGAEKVTAHIVEKMNRNISNGVRYINIHGLGERNVEKIISILPEIQKQVGAVAVRVDKDPTRVFVRLEIPNQISN
jgi:hypothetical protein